MIEARDMSILSEAMFKNRGNNFACKITLKNISKALKGRGAIYAFVVFENDNRVGSFTRKAAKSRQGFKDIKAEFCFFLPVSVR